MQRHLFPHERLLLHVWIASRYDRADSNRHAQFERFLSLLYVVFYHQHKGKMAILLFQQMQMSLVYGLVRVSRRQLIRFYYIGAQIAISQRKMQPALEYLQIIFRELDEQDWDSRIEIMRWQGMLNLNVHQYSNALDILNHLLDELAIDRTIAFSIGDRAALIHHTLFLRAKALFGCGYFEASTADLVKCQAYTQSRAIRLASRGKRIAFQCQIDDESNDDGPFLLPLEQVLPKTLLTKEDPNLRSTLDMHYTTAWQLALNLFWQEIIDLTDNGHDMLKRALKLIENTIASCEYIPTLGSLLPFMCITRSEIALMLNHYYAPLQESPFHWITISKEALSASRAKAQAVNVGRPVPHDFLEVLRFAQYQQEWQEVRASTDRERMQALHKKVAKFRKQLRAEKMVHLEGRTCYLLGKICVDLELDHLAMNYFDKALDIFAQENDFLRSEETRRAKEEL